jgi:hypothetical protein
MCVFCECRLLPGIDLGVGRSPVQRSSTECGVSACDLQASILMVPLPNGGLLHNEENIFIIIIINYFIIINRVSYATRRATYV